MRATKLIELLQRWVTEHGDCVVYVYDGLDPSDLSPAEHVSLKEVWDPETKRYHPTKDLQIT